ncbi:MAG: ParB/RepB/Spo0J family partition protein, partial [Alphaproteobacteria bacterium]
MVEANKKRGLGKGLDVLMNSTDEMVEQVVATSGASELPVDNLVAGVSQPRKHFNDEALDGLSVSIAEKGVLQPLLVRPIADGKHEIIAGERRYRAAKRVGLQSVPVAIMNLTDVEAHEIALIENIQREDLSPIEEAEGFRRMMDDFSYTQEMLSSLLGKSRSHIANTLRLLILPEEVKSMVDDGHLSAGHARNLVGLDNAHELALEIANRALSVRETESFVSSKKSKATSAPAKSNKNKEEEAQVANSLSASLNRKVNVNIGKGGSGKVTISF